MMLYSVMEVIGIEDKRVTLTIRVTKEKSRLLKMKCLQEDITIQSVIEQAIDDYLATDKKQPE